MKKLEKSKKIILRIGHFYRCRDNTHDLTFVGQYVGKVDGMECCVCHKGNSAYAFNVYHLDKPNNELGYETFFYGKEHLPQNSKSRRNASP